MAFKRSGVRFPSPPSGRLNAPPRDISQKQSAISADRHRLIPRAISEVAGIAQLVEHNLAKVGVAGSSPVSRSCDEGG